MRSDKNNVACYTSPRCVSSCSLKFISDFPWLRRLAASYLPLPAQSNESAGAASVSISPKTAALGAGNSLQFTATSSGQPTTDLEWLADGVPGGNSASGTISRSGLYIAPQQVTANATIVVAVSSKTPPTTVSTATVTVLPEPAPTTVSLAPGVASLYPSQARQFTATVKGAMNQGISWFVNGNEGGIPALVRYLLKAPTPLR